MTERMRALPEVRDVAEPVLSSDGRMLRVTVVLEGPELEGKENVVPLLEQTSLVAADHPALVVEETGSPAISKGVNDQRGEDLALSERITLPGHARHAAGGLRLGHDGRRAAAAGALVDRRGPRAVDGGLPPDPGRRGGHQHDPADRPRGRVDYALFYLKREREERARAGGRLGSEALVELASATAGRAIVVSGLALIASTATPYLAGDVIFFSLATGTILVVAVAVASSLTVLAPRVRSGSWRGCGSRRR